MLILPLFLAQTREKLYRLQCKVSGCILDNEYHYTCDRCGESYDYGDFIHGYGMMQYAVDLKDKLRCYRKALFRRCEGCNRVMIGQPKEACCSDKCYSEWVPF